MDGLKDIRIAHIGVIARNIEDMCENYSKLFNLDAKTIKAGIKSGSHYMEYKGIPSIVRFKWIVIHLDGMDIDIIEPGDDLSTWKEFLDTHGEGIHHIAFIVNGLEQKINFLNSNGINLIQTGVFTGGKNAYFDSLQKLGTNLELTEYYE